MTTYVKVSLLSSMVFIEETLDVIIYNGLSVGISCGVARSKSICNFALVLVDILVFLEENWPQKPPKTKKMLRKSPASNAWTTTLKTLILLRAL